MTFAIAGRCAESGMFGIAVTTSSIAVGARCPHARAGVGAVSTQNVTDPTLGPEILDLMEGGLDAEAALARAMDERHFAEYRQIVAIDRAGRTAGFSGARTLGRNAVAKGSDCIAAGNLLTRETVPEAMVSAFAASAHSHLAARLIGALAAGIAAGGEEGPVHSAALLVVHEHAFPLVDLRVDWADEDPVGALDSLWAAYEPQMVAYVIRAVDPPAAPSYAVPGDR